MPKNVVLTLRDDHVNGVEVVKVDEPVLSLGPVLIGDPTLIDWLWPGQKLQDILRHIHTGCPKNHLLDK